MDLYWIAVFGAVVFGFDIAMFAAIATIFIS